jgi:lysylphosphatidylglycerol synthetase-like protein (DUF2156 family)
MLAADPKSILYPVISTLLASSKPFVVLASALMLSGAVFYYRQRSRLAWYYGQIALELAIPQYTANRADEWMKQADSWEAWIPYNCAFGTWCGAIVTLLLAVLSIYVPFVRAHALIGAVLVVTILVLWLLWVRRTMIKFSYEEDISYFGVR